MITSFDKALVAAIMGALATVLAHHHVILNSDVNNALQVILVAVIGGVSVYFTKNKKV